MKLGAFFTGGITPGTVRALKALVVDSSKALDVLTVTALTAPTITNTTATVTTLTVGTVNATTASVSGGLTLANANVALSTTTGSIIGVTTGQKLAVWGATPIVQPVGAGQGAIAVHTITTASTTTTPWGFATSTQADAVAADLKAVVTLVNQFRTDLVAIGLIKGAA